MDAATVWSLLKLPGALRRVSVGVQAPVISLAWTELLEMADANGIDKTIAALLLQAVELKLVLAVNGEDVDYE